MFEEEEPSTSKALHKRGAHRYCQYRSGDAYCPKPAEHITARETRMVEGVGRKSVSLGYCADHYKAWFIEQDRRIADQLMHEFIKHPERWQGKDWHDAAVEQRMASDPVCRLVADNPPRTAQEKSDFWKGITAMMNLKRR